MLAELLFVVASAASGCDGLSGWNDGRQARAAVATCREIADYAEAHRLGSALLELRTERDGIDTRLAALDAAQQAPLRRRQRQIDVDLEAIRGVATTRGWPLDIPTEITP